MEKISRILAVYDPTRNPDVEEQIAVTRAINLARGLGASVEIFLCDYNQYLSGERFFDSPGLKKARASYIGNRHKQIRAFAGELAGKGVEIATDAAWDTPLADGIVRKVLRYKPDLVVKEAHHHRRLQRAIFTNTDWHLVRDCPAPLLLVTRGGVVDQGPVIAAVDPMHDDDKPAELDTAIIELSARLAECMKRDMHVFHAYQPIVMAAGGVPGGMEPLVLPVDITDEKIRKAHTREFQKLLTKHNIDKARSHLKEGDTRSVLFKLIEEQKASLVVMGAVSRGRLERIFVGSTAERILGDVPCDVAVVKPRGFVSPVRDGGV